MVGGFECWLVIGLLGNALDACLGLFDWFCLAGYCVVVCVVFVVGFGALAISRVCWVGWIVLSFKCLGGCLLLWGCLVGWLWAFGYVVLLYLVIVFLRVLSVGGCVYYLDVCVFV